MGKVRRKQKRGSKGTGGTKIPASKVARPTATSKNKVASETANPFKDAKKRREDRKAQFLNKLHSTQKALKRDAEVKKVGKALGEVGTLSDILSEYNVQNRSKDKDKEHSKSKAPQRKRLRNKTRQKILAQEVNLFSRVLSHPAFKDDPCKAVSEHLRNQFGASRN
mmetsp:Transcript_10548/g.13820  ORF Transcript_10548/g.13820 Transcript_10548/m.13820 type:complete len:166 (-) Transcript_10548:732-1229(-)